MLSGAAALFVEKSAVCPSVLTDMFSAIAYVVPSSVAFELPITVAAVNFATRFAVLAAPLL